MESDLEKALEALLLSTAEPIRFQELVSVFGRHHSQMKDALETDEASEEDSSPVPEPVSEEQISAALNRLVDAAEVQNKAYRIVEGPGGYQMVTAPQFADYVRLLRGEPRPMKLSPAALETLSIVAYRQPATRVEMEAIRGVAVDGPLNRLIELELVQVAGRAELPGRPIQYRTTDRFLEFIGVRDLDSLPSSDVLSNQQINDWMRREAVSVTDKDVGLAEEPEQVELALNEQANRSDWQRENIESDAASNE